ncbi:MAG: biotin carboxylase N-terminal domain-containing protein, partial [Sphingomonadales bacterium]
MTIKRILIANRGEIAVRIMETCRRLGIKSILGASEADVDSVPARLADQVICLGGARADQSYLNIEAVVGAAVEAGAEAIHPGYGFLAENPALARACGEAGIIFVGPTAGQLESLGDKLRARELAEAAGLAVLPGGAIDEPGAGSELAKKLGYPILIKAVGGGGGRGMRLVRAPSDLDEAVALAMAEAEAAFGDPRVYLERFVDKGRHVEVQILGDARKV